MKRYGYVLPILLICAVLGLALLRSVRDRMHHSSRTAILMDTIVEVDVWGEDPAVCEIAADSVLALMGEVASPFGDGIVVPERDSVIAASPVFAYLVEMARRAHLATDRRFDPTIGAVSRLWHFWEGARPPASDSIRAELERVGLEKYLAGQHTGPTVFDLGGIAKGYAVDAAAVGLRRFGVGSAIINAGGDLMLVGARPDGRPWRIAVRHPRRPGEFVGYLDIENAAVATSGDYEKFFIYRGRRYHHILDPDTGMPGDGAESVTVVSASTCLSDALATGLLLVGARRGIPLVEAVPGVDALFVWADGDSTAMTDGLVNRFGRFETE